MSNSNNNKIIAKNTILLYIRMAIVMFVNLYTTRIVLANLGVNDYGIYNVVYGFVTMFTVFNTTLTAGVNRYYNYEMGKSGREGVLRVYNVAIRIQVLFAVVVFFLVEIFGVWYVNNYMTMEPGRLGAANWVFQFSVVSMFFLILQNPFSSAVMAFEKMGYFAVISIVDVFLKLGIAIVIGYTSMDNLILFGALMSIISLINCCAYYACCKMKFKDYIHLERTYDKGVFKDMIKFSGWMTLDPVAYSINGQGVNMLLNSFFGTVVNTAFGIANQVGQAIDSFCMNLSTAFRPQMVQSYSSGNINRSVRLFLSMSKICFCLFLLICVPLVFNLEYIYNLWLGDTYPKMAVPISIIFIFIKLIGSINHPISYIIMAKGILKTYMLATFVITCSSLPVAWVLLKLGFSVNAVFIAMLVITILNQIASIFVLSKEIPEIPQKLYYSKVFIPCLLLLLIDMIIVGLSHHLMTNDIVRLVTDTLVSTGSIVFFSFLLCLDNTEKGLIRDCVNNFLRK